MLFINYSHGKVKLINTRKWYDCDESFEEIVLKNDLLKKERIEVSLSLINQLVIL